MSTAAADRYVDLGYYMMCALLVVSPLFFPRDGKRYTAVPVAIGTMGLLSRFVIDLYAHATSAFTPSRELSEAVAQEAF